MRKPAAERREEIYGAVCRIIGRRGLASLTTTSLAEEVGVTSGALFRHFASRDEILEGAVSHALEKIGESFPDPTLPPLERLLALGRNRVVLFRSEPGIAWLLRSEEASLSLPPEAVARLREQVERSARYLLDAIREGVTAGTIRGDIEPGHLLVMVMGTIHALAGMPGVHKQARESRRRESEPVLASLARMLAPPETTAARPARGRPSRTGRTSKRR